MWRAAYRRSTACAIPPTKKPAMFGYFSATAKRQNEKQVLVCTIQLNSTSCQTAYLLPGTWYQALRTTVDYLVSLLIAHPPGQSAAKNRYTVHPTVVDESETRAAGPVSIQKKYFNEDLRTTQGTSQYTRYYCTVPGTNARSCFWLFVTELSVFVRCAFFTCIPNAPVSGH